MPEKADLEEKLNEILDVEMDWSKMKKDDLELLLELVEEGSLLEPLVKYQAKDKGEEFVDNMIDEWYPGKYAGGVL